MDHKQTIKAIVSLFVVAILTGCATADGLIKDAQKGLNSATAKLNSSIKGKPGAKPTKVDEYCRFVDDELVIVKALEANQKQAGLTWQFVNRKLNLKNVGESSATTKTLVASFRVELPGDATQARHEEVTKTIAALVEYVASRNAHEPTRLVLVARDPDEATYMANIATAAFRRGGSSNLPINTEIRTKPAVGWMSEGAFPDRTI